MLLNYCTGLALIKSFCKAAQHHETSREVCAALQQTCQPQIKRMNMLCINAAVLWLMDTVCGLSCSEMANVPEKTVCIAPKPGLSS